MIEISQPLVRIENLNIGFGNTPVLKGVHLDILPGEVVAIVGESGSGKSLTALTLMGLLPKSARVDLNSKITWTSGQNHPIDWLNLPEKERLKFRGKEMAMIFQEPMTSLNPIFCCGAQVTEAILIHQAIGEAEAKKQALALFEQVKLPDPNRIFSAYPHEISGGQKQRIMIAMALANNPQLLIADEPTTALDVTVQKSVLLLLQQLQKERHMAMLFISHDLGVVADLAHKVAVMYRGQLVEIGSAHQIFNAPKHPYTQSLLACRPNNAVKLYRLPSTEDFLTISKNEIGDPLFVATEKPVSEIFRLLQVPTPRKIEVGTDSNVVLDVQSLSVAYKVKSTWWGKKTESVKAVHQVSFQVRAGEMLGIVGESGCGKSTLCNAILGLQKTNSGAAFFNGVDLLALTPQAWRKLRKDIQIVFQDPYAALNPRMRIGEAIIEPMVVHGIGKNSSDRKNRAANLLEQVRLPINFLDRFPHECSGGQRQRIVIARALSVEPAFILFDESVSALDVSVQALVLNLIADLRDTYGFSGMFISHDLSVVRFISDRLLVMQKGIIVEQGDADAVFSAPQHPYTQQLLAALPGQTSI